MIEDIGRYKPEKVSSNLWMVWDTWRGEASYLRCFGLYASRETCEGAIELYECYEKLLEEKRQWTCMN